MFALLLQRAVAATLHVLRVLGAADLRDSSEAGQLQQGNHDQRLQQDAEGTR
jgi:hypothetical protein